MALDSKLNQITDRVKNRTLNNIGNKVSSAIPNITSGLDIPDNGLVKDILHGAIDGTLNSITKSGSLKKSPKLLDISGAIASNTISEQTNQKIKLTLKSEQVKNKSDGDKTSKKVEYDVKEKLTESILLPFPQEVVITTASPWESKEGGILGEKLMQGALLDFGSLENTISNVFNAEFADQLKANVLRRSVDAAGKAIFGTEDASKFYDASQGRLFNPRKVLLFDGIDFRDFNTTFNFAPTSAEESIQVAEFITRVHEAALPNRSGPYFTYPDTFNFAIVDNSNNVLLDRGDVVITNIECNYTPEGVWATFKDNKPIHITLAISWKEKELPTKNKVKRLFGQA